MGWELFLLLFVIAAFLACDVIAVLGTVDALTRPRAVWGRAGYRRISWVWQAVGVMALPLTLVYSGIYFVRVRPRLNRAAAELTVAPTAHHRVARPLGEGSARADVVRIRMPWLRAILLGAAPLIGALIGVALGGMQDGGLSSDFPWTFLACYCALALPLVLLNRYSGVSLTPDGLRLGVLRHGIPWWDVIAITTGSSLGSCSAYAVVSGGRRRRLRAPATMFGIGRARFDADVMTIENYWLNSTMPGQ